MQKRKLELKAKQCMMLDATSQGNEEEAKKLKLKDQNKFKLLNFEQQPEFKDILTLFKTIYRILVYHENPLTMSEQPIFEPEAQSENDEG